MVAHYPNRESSFEVARALIDGGSTYLEVQFPFSDPTADGPIIQTACTQALAQGFRVQEGFELIRRIRDNFSTPVFLMCYANTLFFHGVDAFLDRCRDAGVGGIIVPDLPYDYDEDLFSKALKRNIRAVPVVPPSIRDGRLAAILTLKPLYLYAVLRKGITGEETDIGAENIGFLEKIRTLAGTDAVRILAGFGISRREQIAALSPYVHASIVGTALIREIMERKERSLYDVLFSKLEALLGEADGETCW
jgi:tryptophan synthase alpha chain